MKTLYIPIVSGLSLIIISTGCQSVEKQIRNGKLKPITQFEEKTNTTLCGKWHSVLIEQNSKIKEIHWYERVDPIWWFGNINEPTPPQWYLPSNCLRTPLWYIRNPFSNFTLYTVGVTDKSTVRSGRYPLLITNPNGGWNYSVTSWGYLRLPFVSYSTKFPWGKKSFIFYFGWRERGNFGIAFRLNKEKTGDRPNKK